MLWTLKVTMTHSVIRLGAERNSIQNEKHKNINGILTFKFVERHLWVNSGLFESIKKVTWYIFLRAQKKLPDEKNSLHWDISLNADKNFK